MGFELNFSVLNIWEVIVSILTFSVIVIGIFTLSNPDYFSASLLTSEVSLISSHISPGSEVLYNLDSEKFRVQSSSNEIIMTFEGMQIIRSYRNPQSDIIQERHTLIIN